MLEGLSNLEAALAPELDAGLPLRCRSLPLSLSLVDSTLLELAFFLSFGRGIRLLNDFRLRSLTVTRRDDRIRVVSRSR